MTADSARVLLDRLFPASGSELVIGGVRVSAVAECFGTPTFVYDGNVLDRAWDRVRLAFPPEFSIHYSMKANPNPALVRRLVTKGAGIEIASAGEFHLGAAAGCSPDRMLFAGPGKTNEELEVVLKHGVGEIHLESLGEADRVSEIAQRLDVRAAVGMRVNPGEAAEGGAMRMGGQAAPFGIDEEDLPAVLPEILRRPALEFRGVHLFAGTQILDASTLGRQYRAGVSIARRVAEIVDTPLHTVDFGGGLGIPYFTTEHALDLDALRSELRTLVEDCRRDPRLASARLVIEPGRYLIGEAGVYVTRVTDVKTSRGKTYVIVDGGLNHHLAASGNLGQVIKRNFPVALLDRLDDSLVAAVDVVGPLCTPLDVLARNVVLPRPRVGDLLGVLQSGAYARAASPLGFLSHLTPPEVLLDGGTMTLIRRRGTYEDLLADLS